MGTFWKPWANPTTKARKLYFKNQELLHCVKRKIVDKALLYIVYKKNVTKEIQQPKSTSAPHLGIPHTGVH